MSEAKRASSECGATRTTEKNGIAVIERVGRHRTRPRHERCVIGGLPLAAAQVDGLENSIETSFPGFGMSGL